MTETLLDTNVLLYAISTADEEVDKKLAARELMAGNNWGTAIQVLQEFYVNATRANKPGMSHTEAAAAIRQFLLRPVAWKQYPAAAGCNADQTTLPIVLLGRGCHRGGKTAWREYSVF